MPVKGFKTLTVKEEFYNKIKGEAEKRNLSANEFLQELYTKCVEVPANG